MRNIDNSEWLASPDLEVVEVKPADTAGGRRASEFTVFAKTLTSKKSDLSEEEEAE